MEYLLHEAQIINHQNYQVFANNAATTDMPPWYERTVELSRAIRVLNRWPTTTTMSSFPMTFLANVRTRRTCPMATVWGLTSGLTGG